MRITRRRGRRSCREQSTRTRGRCDGGGPCARLALRSSDCAQTTSMSLFVLVSRGVLLPNNRPSGERLTDRHGRLATTAPRLVVFWTRFRCRLYLVHEASRSHLENARHAGGSGSRRCWHNTSQCAFGASFRKCRVGAFDRAPGFSPSRRCRRREVSRCVCWRSTARNLMRGSCRLTCFLCERSDRK